MICSVIVHNACPCQRKHWNNFHITVCNSRVVYRLSHMQICEGWYETNFFCYPFWINRSLLQEMHKIVQASKTCNQQKTNAFCNKYSFIFFLDVTNTFMPQNFTYNNVNGKAFYLKKQTELPNICVNSENKILWFHYTFRRLASKVVPTRLLK